MDLIRGRQKDIIQKCEDKISEQLEITSLLKKINESHLMLQEFSNPKNAKFLKYNKSRVIDLKTDEQADDEKDSSDTSSDDEVF